MCTHTCTYIHKHTHTLRHTIMSVVRFKYYIVYYFLYVLEKQFVQNVLSLLNLYRVAIVIAIILIKIRSILDLSNHLKP